MGKFKLNYKLPILFLLKLVQNSEFQGYFLNLIKLHVVHILTTKKTSKCVAIQISKTALEN